MSRGIMSVSRAATGSMTEKPNVTLSIVHAVRFAFAYGARNGYNKHSLTFRVRYLQCIRL